MRICINTGFAVYFNITNSHNLFCKFISVYPPRRSHCTVCIFSVCYKIAFTHFTQARHITGDAAELMLNFTWQYKVNVIGKHKCSEGIPAIFVKNSSEVGTTPVWVLYRTPNTFILIALICNYLYKTITKSWTCEIGLIFGIHFREPRYHSVWISKRIQ